MFVALAQFPEVPTERDDEFQTWFAWSNGQLREIVGLQGRRLLRAADGTYSALVEHQSAETFAAMHLTEVTSQVQARLGQVLQGEPPATRYEVLADLAESGFLTAVEAAMEVKASPTGPPPAPMLSCRLSVGAPRESDRRSTRGRSTKPT